MHITVTSQFMYLIHILQLKRTCFMWMETGSNWFYWNDSITLNRFCSSNGDSGTNGKRTDPTSIC